ncbi:hypothetical protein MPER_07151, partial [Moniliophthora perniciosa FA553]
MSSRILVPLSIALSALAVPYDRSFCDVSYAHVIGGTLPPQRYPTSYITLGVGTQNYTCSSSGNYTSSGAVAEIIDMSCMHGGHEFSDIAAEYWTKAPSHMSAAETLGHIHPVLKRLTLGEHYFVINPATASSTSPRWDFTSRLGNHDAFVTAVKANATAAPTGKQDIDWLYLTDIAGTLANEVYRTDTRG